MTGNEYFVPDGTLGNEEGGLSSYVWAPGI